MHSLALGDVHINNYVINYACLIILVIIIIGISGAVSVSVCGYSST